VFSGCTWGRQPPNVEVSGNILDNQSQIANMGWMGMGLANHHEMPFSYKVSQGLELEWTV
jgi:hypothetical protein